MQQDYELRRITSSKGTEDQNPFATRPNSTADLWNDAELESSQIPSSTGHEQVAQLPNAPYEDLPPPAVDSSDPPLNASSLPPMDGGRRAWLFLLGATMIEILLFGLPFSIGILHNYWSNVLFKDQGAEGVITLAASLQSGLLYLSVALVGPILANYGQYRMPAQIAGIVISAISLVAAAFVTEPWHLVITVGLLYPFGGIAYLPCATLLFEWFSTRRGLASGIMYAGSGIGGCIFPFLISGLLRSIGYKSTMIALGIIYGALGGVSLIPIRRRIPLARRGQGGGGANRSAREHRGVKRLKAQWAFAASWPMFTGCMIIVLIGLGNFIPSLWIPSYADDLGLTKPDGTALIAMMNAASIPGCGLLGFLSDRLPVRFVIFIACIATTLTCLLLWGFGTHSGPLVAFSLLYGLFGLSFAALWAKIISVIAKDDASAIPLIFSVFAFLRGIGNITSGPISESLLQLNSFKGAAGAYGFRNYGVLILFTGLSIFSSGITALFFKG